MQVVAASAISCSVSGAQVCMCSQSRETLLIRNRFLLLLLLSVELSLILRVDALYGKSRRGTSPEFTQFASNSWFVTSAPFAGFCIRNGAGRTCLIDSSVCEADLGIDDGCAQRRVHPDR